MSGYGEGTYGGGFYGGLTVAEPAGGGRDASEAVVAVSGDVYVAPVGTPLPTLVRTPLHPSFFKVGLISEEGVSIAWAPETQDFEAMQEAHAIRRELVQQKIAVTFDMLQWNDENVVWAFGGRGSIVEFAANHWRYDFPADGGQMDERSIVIDWEDASSFFRLVFIRGTVLAGLSTTMARGVMKRLPVGFDVLAVGDSGSPGYLFGSGTPSAPVEGTPGFGDGDFGDGDFGG